MKEINLVIEKDTPNFDTYDVRFEVEGKIKGRGFILMEGNQSISLFECPLCEKKTCDFNVASGQCTWCEFNTEMVKRTDLNIG